ncbi:lipoprotein [Nostoc linckia z18]|uniref:Probable 2-phosphosulfolactate phosphatase n=2 Tax=Nostoc linckia TaxID=92942 RepID=A0A9Q5ZF44_NOSLI|nr:2-phosphosulfolactate phosphatase [Nostoc linckia]PHK38970.1 lipoprotein [Nostoc linckia z15]PHK47044.1 lipoprotein [Nostoc linckia z16]PHJ67611.1 lipoprotein [Nostoc linckia z1]PHJ72637.1 lipoprotein [Nostoc linckia z3]PHJ73485.1 lipoprotein [Nostoc linckia z2]
MIYDQSEFDLRCEWGAQGVFQLACISDVVIIVDILSFSTCVEIATNNGAIIFPYAYKDESVIDYAKSLQAELAIHRQRWTTIGYSLSPKSLEKIPNGTRLVLPSANGSFLTLHTGNTPTLTGCLRNCQAVAEFAQKYGDKIAVIPAGERWKDDGSLRPAFEDLIGAGAILSYLRGSLSPEAEAAVAAFQAFRQDLVGYLKKCSSGKELIEKGFEPDVKLAAAFNISDCVPLLTDNAYVNSSYRVN